LAFARYIYPPNLSSRLLRFSAPTFFVSLTRFTSFHAKYQDAYLQGWCQGRTTARLALDYADQTHNRISSTNPRFTRVPTMRPRKALVATGWSPSRSMAPGSVTRQHRKKNVCTPMSGDPTRDSQADKLYPALNDIDFVGERFWRIPYLLKEHYVRRAHSEYNCCCCW
jgi:hypothetical protein